MPATTSARNGPCFRTCSASPRWSRRSIPAVRAGATPNTVRGPFYRAGCAAPAARRRHLARRRRRAARRRRPRGRSRRPADRRCGGRDLAGQYARALREPAARPAAGVQSARRVYHRRCEGGSTTGRWGRPATACRTTARSDSCSRPARLPAAAAGASAFPDQGRRLRDDQHACLRGRRSASWRGCPVRRQAAS